MDTACTLLAELFRRYCPWPRPRRRWRTAVARGGAAPSRRPQTPRAAGKAAARGAVVAAHAQYEAAAVRGVGPRDARAQERVPRGVAGPQLQREVVALGRRQQHAGGVRVLEQRQRRHVRRRLPEQRVLRAAAVPGEARHLRSTGTPAPTRPPTASSAPYLAHVPAAAAAPARAPTTCLTK